MHDDSTTPVYEEWRPVIGYEGIYEVSSLGRVRRVGASTGARVGLLLKPSNDGWGYPKVTLSHENRRRTYKVHILVARAFLGPPPDGMEVNHRDFNRENPAVTNLEYVTSSANHDHAYAHGRSRRSGSERTWAKLNEESVRDIRQSNERSVDLAQRYGVSKATICDVRKGRIWRHVN